MTGGLGFIGSAVAEWAASRDMRVIVVDNNYRAEGRVNALRLSLAGVEIVHGDIRHKSTWRRIDMVDAVVHCASEPAVTGINSPEAWYSAEVNTLGTIRMLQWAANRARIVLLFSTSRVYSMRELRKLELREGEFRFELGEDFSRRGITEEGLGIDFSTEYPGSLYGASKLSAEALVQDWADETGAVAHINRCGVVTGPGQFGSPRQGFFQYFVEACRSEAQVTFRGWGGTGKQVRDVLYINDLLSLIEIQLSDKGAHGAASKWNVSGGVGNSLSLKELVGDLEEKSGKKMNISDSSDTAKHDPAWLILDSSETRRAFGWQPQFNIKKIIEDMWSVSEA